MRCGVYLFVDVQDVAVLPDVKSPAFGDLALFVNHAVCLGHCFSRVAQDGIVSLQCFSIFQVGCRIVATSGEISHVEVVEPRAFGGRQFYFVVTQQGDGQ